MILLIILFIAGGLYGWITYKPPEKKKAPAAPAQEVITLEWCRQQEQERKQAARKAQAQRDIERMEAQAKILHDMLFNAQCMADEDGKTPQYYERMQNKIMSLQNRLAAAENKIEKAKYIIKYE